MRSILPSDDPIPVVSSRLDKILGDDEDEDAAPLSLATIRSVAIRSRTHGLSWNNNFVPAHLFHVGDVGYVPKGREFKEFVLLRNVLAEDEELEVTESATGWRMRFSGGGFDREQLQPFEMPEGVSGCVLLSLFRRDGYWLMRW